ncbi:MAG TPA: superoxide dismutase [Burkholderiales bacterium]|nr:superoxide dismutase [Burkholderiales bacterium]
MAITLPDLPYDYDALQPVISAATMKLHHGAHHRGYVDKLNALVKGSDLEAASLETIVKRSTGAIFNNAAQAWNHAFYWRSLRPKADGGKPQGALAARIDADFGGHQRFCDLFKAAAVGVFGSGWVWLVEEDGALKIQATANADTPIAHGQRPLLVLDVWEHAYYLDYQSRRIAYVEGAVDFLLDWEFAQRNFARQQAVHA